MEPLFSLLAVLLFTLACNLDTVMLSMGYALRGIHLTPGGVLIISALTTAVTFFSLVLGGLASSVFPAEWSDLLGGLVLVGIGAWFLLDALRRPSHPEEAPPSAPAGGWACIPLAAALAVNNAGVGVAAGVGGMDPLWASVCNFAVTALSLTLGRWLGSGPVGRFLGRFALPLSGVLLMVLGGAQVLL